MKCQVRTTSSSLEVSFVPFSTSCRGAAVLSEATIFSPGTRCFRIWIPRSDVLEGDWLTLWMVEQDGCRLVCKMREDYHTVLEVLRDSSSLEVKLTRIRCLVSLNTDFIVRKGY